MADDAKREHIAKLVALREAINDPKSTVDLKQIFFTLIDAALEALKN